MGPVTVHGPIQRDRHIFLDKLAFGKFLNMVNLLLLARKMSQSRPLNGYMGPLERKEKSMSRMVAHVFLGSTLTLLMLASAIADVKKSSSTQSATTPHAIAMELDRQILSDLQKANIPVAERCSDEDFLRRVSLDIVGQLPSSADVATFCQDKGPDKRRALIDKLVASPEFGKNWARYWRDVIYIRATEQRSRINQPEFESWMADQWNRGTGWNETVTAMLTASGNVEEHPETALIFAQGAIAEEVAAESCRIFLGIQLQCANCHDHPSDIWKREQFHQLAAYFPRISERRMNDSKPSFEIVSVNTDRVQGEFLRENPERFIARLDKNKDQKLSKDEMMAVTKMKGKKKAAMTEEMNGARLNPKMIERLLEYGDTNKDGLLTADEIKNMPAPMKMRRGSTEHHMIDLQHPGEEGKVIDPVFFVDGSKLPHGQTDEERRQAVARSFTSPDNPWFARAFVNRIWAEMLGEAFYMPIDDLGPTRTPRFPEVLDALCKGFTLNGHDPKWLVQTIANTDAYQRQIQPPSSSENTLPFASATPVPLRSDIIFSSLVQVFGISEAEMGGRAGKRGNADEMKDKPKALRQNPRFIFDTLFGVDPSTPKDEITGNIPQSLMMMNSRRIRAGMSAKGETRLGKILQEHPENAAAIQELYLLVLARVPSTHEIEISTNYIAEVKNRPEAFEDLMWSLVNSSEFISRR